MFEILQIIGYIGCGAMVGTVAGVLIESRLQRKRHRVRIIGDNADPMYLQQNRNQIDVDEKTARELIEALQAFLEARELLRQIEEAKKKAPGPE